jgi:hypothetical protein
MKITSDSILRVKISLTWGIIIPYMEYDVRGHTRTNLLNRSHSLADARNAVTGQAHQFDYRIVRPYETF